MAKSRGKNTIVVLLSKAEIEKVATPISDIGGTYWLVNLHIGKFNWWSRRCLYSLGEIQVTATLFITSVYHLISNISDTPKTTPMNEPIATHIFLFYLLLWA